MGKGGDKQIETCGRKISLEELGAHRVPGDAWMSYRGKVYDVSNFNDHPGGSVIFTHAGDDFTDIFAAFHPASAMKDMDRFYIGELDESVVPKGVYANKLKPEKQKKFEKAYRELRAKLFSMGMFSSNLYYYLYKVLSNFALLGAAIYCAVKYDSLMIQLFGATLLGLFWQQSGWLAHDFLHHQVFKNHLYGDMMGILIGNICQGFSVHWWKNKHNTHHAVPNLHESSPQASDGDPDIDTMPIIAWSLKMAEQARDSSFGRFMIRWQAVFYFPVLLVARIAWAQQSWVFVFRKVSSWESKSAAADRKNIQYPTLEKIGLILHYIGLYFIVRNMSILNAVLFLLVAECSCGLFLALVFGLGHNGMAVYPANERPDFWKLQVSTTRNIKSNMFTDWFCGGLQYQVDHHLFPMLPRHNLKQVHALVESFCKEHDVTYHETDMWDGTKEVLSHLSKVSTEFVKEFPAM